jgi:crotonobetaine/carnitine-CoA ligase
VISRVLGREIVADNLADLFDWRTERSANDVFVRFPDSSATYAALDWESSRLLSAFADRGLRAGDRLATLMYTSLLHLAIMVACTRAGLIWAPLNVGLGPSDLHFTLSDLQPDAIIVDEELAGRFEAAGGATAVSRCAVAVGPARPGLDSLDEWVAGATSAPIRAKVGAGDACCVIYSGGSTGLPKGISLPHFAAVSCGYRMAEFARFEEREVFFSSSHLYHSWLPLAIIPFCLAFGHEVALWRWWSASRFLAQVRAYRATIVDPFISMVATLLRTPERPDDRDHTARIAISGFGGADPSSLEIRRRFEERFGIRTYQPYGQTEAGGLVTVEFEAEPRRWGSSGKLRGWYEAIVVDADGIELPAGEEGEIWVRPKAPHMMAHGYLNRPEQTLLGWRDLWIHTGDYGCFDADGYLYFTRRQAHFLRRRGELVAVAEVEELVRGFPGVDEVAVIGLPSDLGEDDIACCVVPVRGEHVDPAALVAYCAERIAPFKVPRYVRLLDELPRSAAKGEIERHRLRELGTHLAWDSQAQVSGATSAPGGQE